MIIFVDNSGNVWCQITKFFRANLNLSGMDKIDNFFKIPNLTNIKKAISDSKHAFCLDYEGNVFSFCSCYGEKDPDYGGNIFPPKKINISEPIEQIYSGYNFTLYLSENGNLYSSGRNNFGQLGLGDADFRITPTKINFSQANFQFTREKQAFTSPNDEYIDLASCGYRHTIIKTTDNKIYAFGDNLYGQFGFEDIFRTFKIPTLCNNYPKNVVSISCGIDSSLLLTDDGSVYSFGENCYGQLGRSTKKMYDFIPTKIESLPTIINIKNNFYASFFVDENFDLWVCGLNKLGHLGLNEKITKVIIPQKNLKISDVKSITINSYYCIEPGTIFIKTWGGEIFAFGYNGDGVIIPGGEECYFEPQRVFIDNEHIWMK